MENGLDVCDRFTLLSILAKVHTRKRLQGFGLGQLYPEDEGPGTGVEFFDVSTFEYKICGEDFMLSSGNFHNEWYLDRLLGKVKSVK